MKVCVCVTIIGIMNLPRHRNICPKRAINTQTLANKSKDEIIATFTANMKHEIFLIGNAKIFHLCKCMETHTRLLKSVFPNRKVTLPNAHMQVAVIKEDMLS